MTPLRLVFDLPLQQAQGFVRSIARLTGASIAAPCFSTLSRRGVGLKTGVRKRARPMSLCFCRGQYRLKIFGAGEWLEEKHKNQTETPLLGASFTLGSLLLERGRASVAAHDNRSAD
ncbi:transposase [Mesorhizobium sp. 1M-11]|uniref:transposase n=1 Tax=Mesorhizobium sp. 1M-11 TaxID=1529006 RepID=UPI0006C75D10|nr:transposase [Mesorhizobium sp. 1M-11]